MSTDVWLNWACLGAVSEDRRVSLAERQSELVGSLRKCADWSALATGRPATDVVLTSSATEACDLVLRTSLDSHDRWIVHTNHAFGTIVRSVRSAAQYVQRLADRPIQTGVLDIDPLIALSPDVFAKEFADRLNRLTNGEPSIIVCDHVTSRLGLRLPIELIERQIAGTTCKLVVDGAQAIGLWSFEPQRDSAYFGCFHKYLNCPAGTGFAILSSFDRDCLPAALATPLGRECLPTQDAAKWIECAENLRRGTATDRVERVRHLRAVLLAELLPLHVFQAGGVHDSYWSHILSVDLGSERAARSAWEGLERLGFHTKVDDELMRVSLHHSLNETDLVAFACSLKGLL